MLVQGGKDVRITAIAERAEQHRIVGELIAPACVRTPHGSC
jgi:hypothetical protein